MSLIEQIKNAEESMCDRWECCLHDSYNGVHPPLQQRIIAALENADAVDRVVWTPTHTSCTGCSGVAGPGSTWEAIAHEAHCVWLAFDAAMDGDAGVI